MYYGDSVTDNQIDKFDLKMIMNTEEGNVKIQPDLKREIYGCSKDLQQRH